MNILEKIFSCCSLTPIKNKYNIIKQIDNKSIFIVEYQHKYYIIKLKNSTEINFLNKFNDDDIIRVEDLTKVNDEDYIVFKYYFYGDLFNYIQETKLIAEYTSRTIIKKILLVLEKCYNNNIAHLDIKPENIIIKNINNLDLILIDFDLAKETFDYINKSNNIGGSLNYSAPEMFNNIYTKNSDIWSLGIILYVLLKKEFLYDKVADIDNYYINKKISILNCTNECKDFIKKCLIIDYNKRYNVKQLLKHNWIRS